MSTGGNYSSTGNFYTQGIYIQNNNNTYVSTKSLGKIRSPLDEINLEEITEIAYEEK
jgi:hypothetical protein